MWNYSCFRVVVSAWVQYLPWTTYVTHCLTLFPWHILTLLSGDGPALLPGFADGHGLARLAWNLLAVLFGHLRDNIHFHPVFNDLLIYDYLPAGSSPLAPGCTPAWAPSGTGWLAPAGTVGWERSGSSEWGPEMIIQYGQQWMAT